MQTGYLIWFLSFPCGVVLLGHVIPRRKAFTSARSANYWARSRFTYVQPNIFIHLTVKHFFAFHETNNISVTNYLNTSYLSTVIIPHRSKRDNPISPKRNITKRDNPISPNQDHPQWFTTAYQLLTYNKLSYLSFGKNFCDRSKKCGEQLCSPPSCC